ncbi:MAG: type II secretion system protein GspC [Pseudomonadota bacterium]
MQALIKKYFFVVNLLFIGLAAFLLARAGNIFLGHFLTPALPEVSTTAKAKPNAKPKVERSFATATDRNIFGAKREELVEAAEEEIDDTPRVDLQAEAVPTALNIKLVNTFVFDVAEWSLATIEDLSAKSTAQYSVNACDGTELKEAAAALAATNTVTTEGGSDDGKADELAAVVVRSVKLPTPCNRLLDTATITDIEVTRVTFINESTGRREYIAMGAEPAKGVPVAAIKSSAKPAAGGPTGEGIKQLSENSYEIAQSEVDATLSNLNTIATQARIVPSFQDGKANGFKLFSIRPGSLYAKIGIKNGDVIQRINGYEISSPDKALEIYTKLKDSKNVTVDLLRRGKPQSLEYGIVP